MRAAYADRRLCRQQLILVAIEPADLSGKRAEAAFHQPEDGDFAAGRGAGKVVALDAELGIRLERHQRVIGEAKLRVALCAGDDGVADIDRRAGRQSHPLRPAQRRDIADRKQHLSGGLPERNARGEQAQDERPDLQEGSHVRAHQSAPI